MTVATGDGFGPLLKRLRLRAGLTQEALAERAGVSARAVSDLERDPARTPQFETVILLASALELGTEDRNRLLVAARPEATVVPTRTGHALPHLLTPLVGRTGLVAAIAEVLEHGEHRLVTLTGPGGVGKTRVALAVADRLASRFTDSAVFVDLAPLRDAHLVPTAIARQLAIDDRDALSLQQRLAAALRRRHLLLVLDNFEHLLAARGDVLRLLEACPRLEVLITSRIPLRVRGEREYRVAPLELPERDDAAGVVAPAVRLFLDRARDAGAPIDTDSTLMPMVASICRYLDGLPLAIELAAAWTRLLPVKALLTRLERRLPMLVDGPQDVPARQRTMRDAIAWSYDLLDAEQQRLFRATSVFVDGCTPDAVAAVSGESSPQGILIRLAALVDCSLLQRQDAVAPLDLRLSMLETVREFGIEQLEARGEVTVQRRRHAEHFLALAELVRADMSDVADPALLERLEQEHGNLRAALAWACAANETRIALRLCGALWRFWDERGHLGEGRRWLQAALDLPTSSPGSDPGIRLQALIGAATLAMGQGAFDEAEVHTEEAVSLARETGQDSELVTSLVMHGRVAWERGQYVEAARRYDEALSIARVAGDRRGEGAALAGLGYVKLVSGELTQGMATAERGVELLRAAGSIRELASALISLAAHLSHTGAHAQTEELGTEALALFRKLGNSGKIPDALWVLGLAKQFQGRDTEAVALHEENLALRRARGDDHGTVQPMSAMALIYLQHGEYARSRTLLDETLVILETIDDRWSRSMSLMLLGHVELATNDPGRAVDLILQAVALMQEIGNRLYVPWCLEGLAGAAAAQSAWALAARLIGTRDAIQSGQSLGLPPADPAAYARTLAHVREVIGDDAFAAAHAAGQALPLDQAVAEATDALLPRERPV